MTEPTPPPERPLPDDARARLRADLLAHAHDRRSTTPRWLVPAGAAAAVALVAGLGYWAIDSGTDRADPGIPVTGGGGDSTVTATPSPGATSPSTPTPMSPTPKPPSSVPSTETSVPAPQVTVEVGTRSCPEEMEFVLKGAALALQVDDVSSFWVKGDRFVQCDELDGRTTVHRALPLTPADKVATYAVSTDLLDGQVTRSAGGIVPPGLEEVFDVAYTFPDGHTERGTKSTDDQGRTWWRMIYTYDEDGGSELKKPRIEVRMRLSGAQKDYTLEWGMDTCAQANHGC
jgi:hypothetical protein